MEVVVLGAGVIGLSTAYYLHAAGHQVSVIERHTQTSMETSYANGGQLSYSYVSPLAGPGVLEKIPGWLCSSHAPMQFRPACDLDQWRWCLAFVRACTRQQNAQSTQQLLQLSFLSRGLMHQLVRDEPALRFDYVRSGKLVLHRDATAYHAALELLALQKTLGCEQQALDVDACLKLEPALKGIAAQLAGGIFTASEETGDCYRFCLGLEHLLRRRGVEFQCGTQVDALRDCGTGLVEISCGARTLRPQQIVIALGCASTALLKPLGIRLPVYPLRGYSLTLATTPASIAPAVSITDSARKVVYARLGDNLRVAGMADLGTASAEHNQTRLMSLQREAQRVFPDAGDYSAAAHWTGLRPATPQGKPILGPTRYRNLWLNVGQGALGFTLATGSARLLSDWISGKPGAIDRTLFCLPH